MNQMGDGGMWDEEDGFYYDVLRLPDGTSDRLRLRSMVGLLPLCATTVIEPWQRKRLPQTEATNLKSAFNASPSFCRASIRLAPNIAASEAVA